MSKYINEVYEEAIAAAHAYAERLEIKGERLLAESDLFRDRALTLEQEYAQYKAENETA